MEINIRVDDKKLKKGLTRFQKQYHNEAVVTAMNWFGFDAIDLNKKLMLHVFKNPTPGTLKSLRFKKATKNFPVLSIFHIRRYSSALTQNVEGDQRRKKRFEYRMGDYYAISRNAPGKDGYGNLKNGAYTKILADLQKFSYSDSVQNTKLRSQRYAVTAAAWKRGQRKGRKGKGVTYFQRRSEKTGKPIIYQKIGGPKGRKIKPVLVAIPRPKYRPIYPFYKAINRMFNRKFPRMYYKAVGRAIKKAFK